MKILKVFCLFWAIFQVSIQQDPQLVPLAPLASNISTVSGFSAGGALAFQFYLSHSNVLRGCAIFSGLIYECGFGQESETFRLARCTRASYNYQDVVKYIEEKAASGLFDPLENLKNRRHYVSHGTSDPLVKIGGGNRIAQFFRDKAGDSQVLFNGTGGAHGYPTESCGLACPTRFPPSLNGCLNCGWSGAFESLNYIYGGSLRMPSRSTTLAQCEPKDGSFEGLKSFDQREFFPPGSEKLINMGRTGYIYIPPQCQRNPSGCTLLVHIHGCGLQASSPLVRRDYIKCSGLMEVAEANDIIVIFPQAALSLGSISSVLQCWDFIGYTGKDYGTKKGSQIQAIKGMMDRVFGSYTANNFK